MRWKIQSTPDTYTTLVPRGSFDSTCMLFVQTLLGRGSGARSLTSPPLDLMPFLRTELHFDYNFYPANITTDPEQGSIHIEGFNGQSWVTLFRRIGREPLSRRSWPLWDSLPGRVFVPLDAFRNTHFRLRITVDDGSLAYNRTRGVFAAFDNIRIDGYPLHLDNGKSFLLYPNPAESIMEIRFRQPPAGRLAYRLTDAAGRQMATGLLLNGRLSVAHLPAGLYFIQVFSEGRLIGTEKCLKQH
jgi:hypothetical protein